MPAEYSFVSRWRVPASADRTWEELERRLRPSSQAGGEQAPWWPGLAVDMAPRRLAAGERLVLTVRSPLGYRLRLLLELTLVEPGRRLAARSDGDLRGGGAVTIEAAGVEAGPMRPEAPGDAPAAPGGGVGTVVEFQWDVETRRAWMNATAPVLRAVFERAHAHVMRRGEAGLRAAVAVRHRSDPRNAGNPGIEAGRSPRAG
ncbi:hypothetical protein [Microbacterium yannicii]|uniref:hypothetical protein n=1 Tax=Microbacterium yannicii TaxID=671622 RepID=UPI00036E7048|nr:hypothetical protein [Microbacterium yannicii]